MLFSYFPIDSASWGTLCIMFSNISNVVAFGLRMEATSVRDINLLLVTFQTSNSFPECTFLKTEQRHDSSKVKCGLSDFCLKWGKTQRSSPLPAPSGVRGIRSLLCQAGKPSLQPQDAHSSAWVGPSWLIPGALWFVNISPLHAN